MESAGRIERTYPAAALPDLVKDKDPVAWSLEGRTIAIDSAYLHGQLPGTAVDTKNSPIPLPPDYLAKGKIISDQRLALAGYRLAAMLPPLLTGTPATSTTAATTATTTATAASVTTAVAPGSVAKPAVVPSAAAALAAAPGVFDKRPPTSTPPNPVVAPVPSATP